MSRLSLEESSGTMKIRVGVDSQKQFDCCWLCNQCADQPVTTSHGLLYCKVCIVENMFDQKKLYKQQLADYESKQQSTDDLKQLTNTIKESVQAEASKSLEDSLLPKTGKQIESEINAKVNAVEQTALNEGKQDQASGSFWVPQHTPGWTETGPKKPDSTVRCPFSKKKLKLKDLRPILWKEQPDSSSKTGRYMCPLSNSTFKNGVSITILPSGHAVSKKGLQKCIGRADPFVCPLTQTTVDKKNCIDLVKSGTSFASSMGGELVGSSESKKYRHSLNMAIS